VKTFKLIYKTPDNVQGSTAFLQLFLMYFLYSSHSGEIKKITAVVHIRASMKINIKHKTKY